MSDDYPTNHEAERCLLSCVMRGGGEVRQRAADRMRPEMFDRYEDLARLVLSIARDGRPDPDTVRAEYSDEEKVEEVLQSRPSPTQVGRFMHRVQESYGKLKLIGIAQDSILDAKNGKTFDEAATALEEDVIDLTQRAGGAESRDSSKVLKEVLEDLEDEQGQRVTGIPTPFPEINRMTRGFHGGELIIPFGSTSMGKTAFALTCALHAAKEGYAVAIHTLEMSEKRLYRRLIQMESGVKLRQTTIPEEEWSAITQACTTLHDLTIRIVDSPGVDYLSHRSSVRRLKYEHGIDLAVIDYLQIMSAPPSTDYTKKHHQVHDAAQGLKDTAKILDIPVITPSQTTKSPDNRSGDKRPTLSDLREAGEEPTDLAIGLYRPEYYGITQWPEGGHTEGEGVAIVSKQRNGPTGETKLAFVKDRIRWQPLADRRESVPQADDESPF